MKRTQKWLVIAGALGSIFVVGFAAREMLFAQQNNRPQNDTWGPNSIPLPLPNPNARQIPMPAMVPPGTTPPPQAVSPYPGGPTASIPYSGVQQWTPGPQSFPPSHPNPSYPTPYPLPTISASTGYVPSSVHVSSGAYAPPGNIHLSPASHSNTLATSRLLQQYAACDDEAKKEELVSQIKKLVTSEFEEKHSVTKRMLESLEKTTQKLREATEKREASKDKIADASESYIGNDVRPWHAQSSLPSLSECLSECLSGLCALSANFLSANFLSANFLSARTKSTGNHPTIECVLTGPLR